MKFGLYLLGFLALALVGLAQGQGDSDLDFSSEAEQLAKMKDDKGLISDIVKPFLDASLNVVNRITGSKKPDEAAPAVAVEAAQQPAGAPAMGAPY